MSVLRVIKGTYSLTKPDDATATLTLTMTVGEWRLLRAQIADTYPGWRVAGFIAELVGHAHQSFDDQLNVEAP